MKDNNQQDTACHTVKVLEIFQTSHIGIKNSIVMNVIKHYVHGFHFCYGGDIQLVERKG